MNRKQDYIASRLFDEAHRGSVAPSLRRSPPAFTLMEVLIAMAIFAIGMIAVAAVFPVGVMLQRETINAVVSEHVGNSVEAQLLQRGFVADADWDGIDNYDLSMVPDSAMGTWTMADRSYPANEPNVLERQFYWIPLVLDIGEEEEEATPDDTNRLWMVYYFVLRREGTIDYTDPVKVGIKKDDYPEGEEDDAPKVPGVRLQAATASADKFSFTNFANGVNLVVTGDLIIDQFGGMYRVTDADNGSITVDRNVETKPFSSDLPTEFWYAPGGAAKEVGVLLDSDRNRLVHD